MRERQIERALVNGVHALGGMALKFVSPGQRGVPDRIVIMYGKIWFVELKSPHGTLRPWQKRMHEKLKSLGCAVRVFRSLEEVNEFLDWIR